MSVVLQAKFLERAGHTVTFVSPSLRSGPVGSEQFIDLPSWPIPAVREYTWLWPRSSHLALIDAGLKRRPPVDIVHVQSELWGAAFGYRFARNRGLPVVHTMHNRLDVGIDRSFPLPRLLYRVLWAWQKWALREGVAKRPHDAFSYMARFAAHADAVIAPSRHFARLLASKGVVTRSGRDIDVVPTGVDDDVLNTIVPHRSGDSTALRVAWVGRFSHEKRLLEFCDAVSAVSSELEVTIVGDGALRLQAVGRAPRHTVFTGSLPYAATLQTIADADVLVQSSAGFETQGMTITEALALGTHVVLVDSEIAAELPAGRYSVTRDESVEALTDTLDACARSTSLRSERAQRSNRAEYLQSSRTAEAVTVYESLRENGAPPSTE